MGNKISFTSNNKTKIHNVSESCSISLTSSSSSTSDTPYITLAERISNYQNLHNSKDENACIPIHYIHFPIGNPIFPQCFSGNLLIGDEISRITSSPDGFKVAVGCKNGKVLLF